MVSAAFDELTTEPTAPEPAPKADQEPAGDRARGPDGKFVRAEAEPPADPPAPATPKAPAAEPAAAKPEPPDFAKATATWSQADRDAVAKLPDDAKEFVLRRERERDADYTRKTQEIAGFRRDYEPIDQLLSPHADMMREKGFTKAALIQAWYNVEKGLMQGGPTAAQLVAGIVDNYRLDRSAIARALGITPSATQAVANPPQPQPEPGTQPIQLPPEIAQKFKQYDDYLAQQAQTEQRRAQLAYNDAATRVVSEIDQFAAASDSAGALLHPHFRAVENDMAVLAQLAQARGKAVPPLSDLYDQAVWANPSTRAEIRKAEVASQEAQRAASEKTSRDEARAKAERATRAAKSTTGAPPPGQARRSTGSLRDELLEAADQLESA